MTRKAYQYWSTAQALFGVVATGLGIAAVMMESKFSNSAVPLWSGAWFIMTGLLGISAARSTNNACLVGGHLTFSIISAMYAINMTVLFATASAEEEEITDGAPVEARAAVDISLATTGILEVIMSVRCVLYAGKICCSGHTLTARQNAGRSHTPSRAIEVTARSVDREISQSPSTVIEPPSYAYINSVAPQSCEIRFANGSYPPVPPYADQPPSYSEVTAGMAAWPPASVQIQISYTATTENQQGQAAATEDTDRQTRETRNCQGTPAVANGTGATAERTPAANMADDQNTQSDVEQFSRASLSDTGLPDTLTPVAEDTGNRAMDSEGGQNSQQGQAIQ